MKIIKILAILIFIILGLLVITFGVYGGFSKINIVEKEMGDYTLISQKHIGDYSKISPKMNDIYEDLKNNHNLDTVKGFGIFYDNPQNVEKSELRSVIGSISEVKDFNKEKISEKYSIFNFPKTECVVAEFPIKGQISYIVGAIKVYISMNKYLVEKQYEIAPFMEVYDQTNKKIYYIYSKELKNDFYNNLLEKTEVK